MSKQLNNALCFVQFLHPGVEHCPETGRDWNKGDHKRKFLISPGRCVRDDKVIDTELVFWGEWEPESEVITQFIKQPLPEGPQYLYRPFYAIPQSCEILKNTDPFVFGPFFLYGNCLQYESGPTKQVRYLKRGSTILFGSCIDDKFVLDTVFVVRDYIDDYNISSYESVLKGRVPHDYMEVTLNPLFLSGRGKKNKKGCSSNKSKLYRLYFGATYDERVDGMFSFFPCLPFENSSVGFARPTIEDLSTNHLHFSISNQNRGINLNKKTLALKSLSQVRDLWQCVVDQVLKEGLYLGVYAQMPEHRSR